MFEHCEGEMLEFSVIGGWQADELHDALVQGCGALAALQLEVIRLRVRSIGKVQSMHFLAGASLRTSQKGRAACRAA